MVNEKECRRRFDRIVKRGENEGYSNWKEWVQNEVKSYDREKMSNLIKRTEIKLKNVSENDKFVLEPIAQHFVTILVMLVPLVATVILTAFNIEMEALKDNVDAEKAMEFFEMVADLLTEASGFLLGFACIYALIAFLFPALVMNVDARFHKKKINTQVYYEELLIVLNEVVVENKEKKG